MKVKELIKELQIFDPEAPVLLSINEEWQRALGVFDQEQGELSYYKQDKPGKWDFQNSLQYVMISDQRVWSKQRLKEVKKEKS